MLGVLAEFKESALFLQKLPAEAKSYVEYVERAIGCHITYVSVGPEREAYIRRD